MEAVTKKQLLGLFFLLVALNETVNAFTCEKVCSAKNHYRKDPVYHAQVSLKTPAALGKTKPNQGTSDRPKFFTKRSSLITEFDLPSSLVGGQDGNGGERTVIVREGLV